MPKYVYDRDQKKVVENENFVEDEVENKTKIKDRYTANDAIDWPNKGEKYEDVVKEGYENIKSSNSEITLPSNQMHSPENHEYYNAKTDKEMFDMGSIDSKLPCDVEQKYEAKDSIIEVKDTPTNVKSRPVFPRPFSTSLKFREDTYIFEVQDYIMGTYEEHYAKGEIQTFELIASSGHADGFTLGSIQKYAARYGKKDGYNRKDLLKIIHYALLQLWVHDNKNKDRS